MLIFSGAMVLVFGGLTLWLHDDTFIKVKPTIYYLMVSGILLFGLWTGRPTLQVVLDSAFPGLTERGWSLLLPQLGLFFIAMAIAERGGVAHHHDQLLDRLQAWARCPPPSSSPSPTCRC